MDSKDSLRSPLRHRHIGERAPAVVAGSCTSATAGVKRDRSTRDLAHHAIVVVGDVDTTPVLTARPAGRYNSAEVAGPPLPV